MHRPIGKILTVSLCGTRCRFAVVASREVRSIDDPDRAGIHGPSEAYCQSETDNEEKKECKPKSS